MAYKERYTFYRIIGLKETRMESLITLNCSNYTKNIVDVLRIFQQIGWDIYNPQGKVEYLPIGDIDEYNWQCENLLENRLYGIIADKITNKEQIGVNLFYKYGPEAISLMAYDTEQIALSLSINRKIITRNHTDSVWYIEKIIYKILDVGVNLLSYKLEEYED